MERAKPHIAILLANLIYAGNFTIAKFVVPDFILPFGMILIRVTAASAMFWIVSQFFKKETIEKQDLLRFIACAFFGVALNQMTFFKGLAQTNPINPAIMMTTTPILVLFASAVLLKEKISARKLVGIFMGMGAAVGLLLYGGGSSKFEVTSETIFGDFLVMINAASYAVYLVISKPLFQKYEPLTVIKWTFTFGIFGVLPFGGGELLETNFSALTDVAWISLLYVVIMTTFFAYLFNSWALKRVSPTIVSIYIYSQPLLAAIIAVAMGKDEVTVNKVLFALIIFTGVYLVSMPERKKSSPKIEEV